MRAAIARFARSSILALLFLPAVAGAEDAAGDAVLVAVPTPKPPIRLPGSLAVSQEITVRQWANEGFSDIAHRIFATDQQGAFTFGLQLDAAGAWPRDKAALFGPGAPLHADSGTAVPE